MGEEQMKSAALPGPTISIAMATYNGARYLREQLDSIARQTRLPSEIVITDDGSSDETAEIVQAFARTAPFPVRFLRNETRLKYADNFLRAASLCTGELIALCDQDDIWLEHKLERMSQWFDDPELLLAMHSAETLLPSGARSYCYPDFAADHVYLQGECNPFWNRPGFCMVLRAGLVRWTDNSKRPVKLLSHDHWFLFLAASAGKIATVKEVLSLYRQHETNVYGVPEQKSLLQKLSVGVETPDYDAVAAGEYASARSLEQVLETCPPEWAPAIRRSITLLDRRAQLHQWRGTIYKAKSHLPGRVATFLKILFTGGYGSDQTQTRLGSKAAVKDLLIGIPSLYKPHETAKTA